MDARTTNAEDIIAKFRIPPKPTILIDLQQALANPDSDPIDFAEIISRDVALAAMVLKTVNSPLFALKREMSDINQAVIMLGAKRLEHLVTYYTLRQSFTGKCVISLEKFWDNTMEVATMSRFVLRYLSDRTDVHVDELYALGLFRDCGIPLMAMKYDNYREVLAEANRSPERCFTEVEESHYATNHAIVGYFVASSWHLPKSLCELILRHHDPLFLDDAMITETQKDLYALMKIASKAVSRYKYDKTDPEWPMAQEAVLTHFGFSDMDFNDMMADLLDEYDIQFGELDT